MGRVRIKKMFPEKITHKISETNSRFQVKAHSLKILISISQEFSSSINKTFIFAGRLGTGPSFYVI